MKLTDVKQEQFGHKKFRSSFSLSVDSLKNSQGFEEEIDNIQVQIDTGNDVLFRREFSHQDMCVINDEETK